MPSERFELPFRDMRLAAVHDRPKQDPRASAILLAHGAGFHLDSPWMAALAQGLVGLGFAVLRFNYPYRQRALARGRMQPPDRAPVLEEAHALALAELERRCEGRRILMAGKSLGGRMATHLAAKGERCAGLLLFGYPLHPPRKPEKTRSEHFPAIAQPALFLQGTRDDLADLGLLRKALQTYGGRATLEVIEGANHGFELLRRDDPARAGALPMLLERVERWERAEFPE